MPAPASNSKGIEERERDANGILLGEWDADFCGCFTHCIPNCCMVYCLPFIPIAQIAHRLNLARFSHVVLAFLGLYVAQIACTAIFFVAVTNDVHDNLERLNQRDHAVRVSSGTVLTAGVTRALSAISLLLFVLAIWQLRTKTRERFQIPGSCLGDFCAVMWCSCCTLAQMATHVKSYKPGSCDFGPPDTLPAYQ